MLSTRPLMSEALPAPSMIVVFSFSTRIFLASPRSFSVAFSSDKPTSSEITVPPVRMAMSCSMALRRSPKPGALTAATLTMPRLVLTTNVASASPSTSSATISSCRPPFAIAPAHHVLAQIDDFIPRRRLEDLYRDQFIDPAHSGSRRSDQYVFRRRDDLDRRPAGVIVAAGVPACLFESRVIRLAVVNRRIHDRAGRRPPLRVGADDFAMSVLIGHFELTQKRQTIAVVIVRTGKTDDPSIPTVAEYGSHRVTAAVQ